MAGGCVSERYAEYTEILIGLYTYSDSKILSDLYHTRLLRPKNYTQTLNFNSYFLFLNNDIIQLI